MNSIKSIANLFIIAAPSGCGKTSLVEALKNSVDQLKVSISCTTRPMRLNDKNNLDYYFISKEEFEMKIEKGDFLEHAKIYGHYYGTPRTWVFEQLKRGVDVILEIDWQGAQQICKYFPQSISIFILPPSIKTLEERLKKRKKDNAHSIQQRLSLAQEEIRHYVEFDYVVINDIFENSVKDLTHIILALRSKTEIQQIKHRDLVEDLLNKE